MDDRLARLFYEDNILARIDRLRGDVNLLQKLATITSVDMGTLPVPGDLTQPTTFIGKLGIFLLQLNQQIEILREGVDHAHELARWTSDGSGTFELPDIWASITWVTIRGVLEDPFMYSLSADGTQLVFDDDVPQGWVIVALGEAKQV